jgi:hypothetical protein
VDNCAPPALAIVGVADVGRGVRVVVRAQKSDGVVGVGGDQRLSRLSACPGNLLNVET